MHSELFEPLDIYHLPLDQSIVELKKIAKQVSVSDILQMDNIEKIIMLKRLIETMEIPIPLIEE